MTQTHASGQAVQGLRAGARRLTLGMLLLIAGLLLAIIASLIFGSKPLPLDEVLRGMLTPSDTEASIIVWTQRIPRTVLGVLAGIAFGVSGALIQALTRNPLADPGILGVNAGAGFAVTVGVALSGASSVTGYIPFAFLGAAGATVLVYLIASGGRSSASPVTLVLAGVALGAVLNGISITLELLDEDTFRAVRNWGVGSIDGIGLQDTLAMLPFIVIGLAIALVLSRPLNTIALGDELAASLGTNVILVRTFGIIAITLLAGGATALTGGIGFVGLMVPHVVRWFTGPDQRWIILCSTFASATLVLTADVIGRVVAWPGEIKVGIVMAVIGAPMLIALVRRRKASGL